MAQNISDVNIRDVEFMLKITEPTQKIIHRFAESLANTKNKEEWIILFKVSKQVIPFETKALELLDESDTPFKNYFRIIQSETMTLDNADDMRERFLSLRKQFELMLENSKK